ncbi:5-(carboxyamino)imidazole ribonucleotide synthase [Parvicella tangerina]|uniref:N5-carboxyaminoimidazole ribonucleotide synthase n=1 Tax=Parvicella tangerina TaxID=2829795 RepID=A0A916JLN9_9FLAO|nr:5-(carboxyamino)imidazole ribonucleotide synthase [Parvicella tangerina]CAG5080237.1 N5-carboxyaminoimidazole ribonucleotide synthase [Parvicella tangerina]
MSQFSTSNFKLGIICGGQLGRMLGLAAANWDITTYVLDATENCPSSKSCDVHVLGHHMDYDAVYNFGKKVDMLTFEIEHVNMEALRKLKSEGLKIFPDPELLAIIQDKGIQKQFYAEHKIPTSPFDLYDSKEGILEALNSGQISFPFVQKSRAAGYDGKGVAVIQSAEDLHKLMDTPSMVEDAVAIDKELSVIVARNERGETKCYPIVDMVFNHEANLVDYLLCPADVSQNIELQCQEIALKIAEQLDLVGLLAVELFLDKKGNVLVNECAPRTHNSGHHTIESNYTSQFEQQLRAIMNYPLGDTTIKTPAVMVNLIGEDHYKGPVYYEGFEEVLRISGAHPHIYGKRETKPFRKMGHITVLGSTVEEAVSKAKMIKKTIKVIST